MVARKPCIFSTRGPKWNLKAELQSFADDLLVLSWCVNGTIKTKFQKEFQNSADSLLAIIISYQIIDINEFGGRCWKGSYLLEYNFYFISWITDDFQFERNSAMWQRHQIWCNRILRKLSILTVKICIIRHPIWKINEATISKAPVWLLKNNVR